MGEVVTPEPVNSPTGVSKFLKGILFTAPLFMMAAAWGGAFQAIDHVKPESMATVPVSVEPEPDGPKLFLRHCANCHGEKGDGKGLTYLDPKARYFGYEPFKFVSTKNGIPTDDDLLRTIRRGVTGSPMHPFEGILTEPQMRAIVAHLRELTRRGRYAYERQLIDNDKSGELEYEPLAVAAKVIRDTEPGETLAVPKSFPPVSPESLTTGKALFAGLCASCHGPNGDGNFPGAKDLKLWDKKTPARPFNFVAGVYRGGNEPEQIYKRIRVGIPYAAMPGNDEKNLTDENAGHLVNYVRSLSGPK